MVENCSVTASIKKLKLLVNDSQMKEGAMVETIINLYKFKVDRFVLNSSYTSISIRIE
jgi:hypothetical protein